MCGSAEEKSLKLQNRLFHVSAKRSPKNGFLLNLTTLNILPTLITTLSLTVTNGETYFVQVAGNRTFTRTGKQCRPYYCVVQPSMLIILILMDYRCDSVTVCCKKSLNDIDRVFRRQHETTIRSQNINRRVQKECISIEMHMQQ